MGSTVVTAVLSLPGVAGATAGNSTVGRLLREALAAAAEKPAALCFVAAVWDAANGLRAFGTLDELNTEGNDESAVLAAEEALNGLRIPSATTSPGAGEGATAVRRSRGRALGAPPSPTPSQSTPPRLSIDALAAAIGAPGSLPPSGCLVELNVLALVVGSVSDPAAQAVAARVATALSAADVGTTLLAPALIAAGEAQGGPPGLPAPGGAALLPASLGVQLIPRLAIAPSAKRRSSLRVIAEWVVGAIAAGSALACLLGAAAALRRWLRREKRAAAVAPQPLLKLATPPRETAPSEPLASLTVDTAAASEPRQATASLADNAAVSVTRDEGGAHGVPSEAEEVRLPPLPSKAEVRLPPHPPRARPLVVVVAPQARVPLPPLRVARLDGAPPQLPHQADAMEDLCTDQTLKRAMGVLKRTKDKGAALLGKPRELAALQQGIIMRASSDRVWWSSPHAPKGKARVAEKGFGPIDRERLEYMRRGEMWPPAHPKDLVLTPADVAGIGGHAAAEEALWKAALIARGKSRPQ